MPPPLTGAFPGGPTTVGAPQPSPLLVTHLLDWAARWHAATPITSLAPDGSVASVVPYAAVRSRALAGARALVALGVRPGDVVATLALNSEPHFASWFAVAGAGACLHSLNPRLFIDDLAFIAHDARDTVVLFDAEFAPLVAALRPRLPGVREWIVLRGEVIGGEASTGGPVRCFEALIAEHGGSAPPPCPPAPLPPWPVQDTPETAAAGLCYTSGTTGRPKGVVYTHRSNTLHALAASLADGFGLCAADSALVAVPLFHANAWGLAHSAPLVGAALILPGRATDGPALARAAADLRPTLLAGVPTVFLGLTAHLRAAGKTGPAALGGRLRAAFVGGAACPPSLIAELEGSFGARVRHVWGMTEISPVGTVSGDTAATAGLTGAARDALTARQGRPASLIDARIVEPQEEEGGSGGGTASPRVPLPHDGVARGELQVRGPFVLHSYLNAPASALDADGYFSTGDLATIAPPAEGGWVTIVDRAKDLIKSGGEWISGAAVEGVACGAPGVAEAACVGVPDPQWTERPLLLVVPSDPASPPHPEGVRAHCRGAMASWWVPDRVLIVPELPHTATGKLNKVAIRGLYGKGGGGAAKL